MQTGCRNRQPLDLDGIAARIEEEHRPLLAGLAFETHDRRNVEAHALLFQALGQHEPIRQAQHHAHMRHQYEVVADLAGPRDFEGLAQMQRQLMAKEIEIDPGIRAAPFLATKHVAVEPAGLIEIGDVKGEMEKRLHLELLCLRLTQG